MNHQKRKTYPELHFDPEIPPELHFEINPMDHSRQTPKPEASPPMRGGDSSIKGRAL
jgi:hypothetical protein